MSTAQDATVTPDLSHRASKASTHGRHSQWSHVQCPLWHSTHSEVGPKASEAMVAVCVANRWRACPVCVLQTTALPQLSAENDRAQTSVQGSNTQYAHGYAAQMLVW